MPQSQSKKYIVSVISRGGGGGGRGGEEGGDKVIPCLEGSNISRSNRLKLELSIEKPSDRIFTFPLEIVVF